MISNISLVKICIQYIFNIFKIDNFLNWGNVGVFHIFFDVRSRYTITSRPRLKRKFAHSWLWYERGDIKMYNL